MNVHSSAGPEHASGLSIDISDALRRRDASALVTLLSRGGIFVDVEMERRLISLITDRLITDTTILRVIEKRDAAALEDMIDRLKCEEQRRLREARANSADRVEECFDLRDSGLSLFEVEDLRGLLHEGVIAVEDVLEALEHSDINTLRAEIDRLVNDLANERARDGGRTR